MTDRNISTPIECHSKIGIGLDRRVWFIYSKKLVLIKSLQNDLQTNKQTRRTLTITNCETYGVCEDVKIACHEKPSDGYIYCRERKCTTIGWKNKTRQNDVLCRPQQYDWCPPDQQFCDTWSCCCEEEVLHLYECPDSRSPTKDPSKLPSDIPTVLPTLHPSNSPSESPQVPLGKMEELKQTSWYYVVGYSIGTSFV
eukprot:UN24855